MTQAKTLVIALSTSQSSSSNIHRGWWSTYGQINSDSVRKYQEEASCIPKHSHVRNKNWSKLKLCVHKYNHDCLWLGSSMKTGLIWPETLRGDVHLSFNSICKSENKILKVFSFNLSLFLFSYICKYLMRFQTPTPISSPFQSGVIGKKPQKSVFFGTPCTPVHIIV